MLRNTILTLIFLFAAGSADADWAVIRLGPGELAAVGDGQQVGAAGVLNNETGFWEPHASLWSSTPGSWVDLNPAGSHQSVALGVSGGHQAGWAIPDGGNSNLRASLWSGTAASWVDLNPIGADNSIARGISGNEQVGRVYIVNYGVHASLWHGNAASWVDLSPAGTSLSDVYATDGTQQVGVAEVSARYHASLWNGTAASWVDLSPVGSTNSFAYGVSDGQQVGQAAVNGEGHPSLWTGTAASWISLRPLVAFNGTATAVSNGYQVGWVNVGGNYRRASLWHGSAATWVDLDALLPSGYFGSEANGVWRSPDGIVYVVGSAPTNVNGGARDALMWVTTETITASSTTLGPGIVVSGTPADLNSSNDVYYTLRPGVVLSSSQSPIVLNASYTLPGSSALVLNSVVESRAQQANIQQTIEAFDFSTSTYALFSQQVLPTTTPDTVITRALGPPAIYIGPGNEVRLKISYKAVGPILSYPWRVFIDEATLRFTPNP